MAKKDISRQKKFDTRIDFTPMVDMNMLLITFFMLCTTMIKSQTLQLALPTNEKIEQEEQNQAKASEAITFIVTGKLSDVNRGGEQMKIAKPEDGRVFFYDGQANPDDPSTFNEIKLGAGGADAIRTVLQERNKEVLKEIKELKEQWKKGEINDSVYQLKAEKARNNESYKRPVVMIKATSNASYADVVSVLDEMQINNISRYQIERLSAVDSTMLKNKGISLE
jgi:biopolymer transport protein ExbD